MTTTYCGPQHDAVATLVERAGQLAPAEISQLATATRAASHCGRQAAAAYRAAKTARITENVADIESAVLKAAIDRATIQLITSVAGRNDLDHWIFSAALGAASDAALALATRHLIGRDYYTQDYYDALTRPWRQAIGPVHPDDPAL